VRLQVEGFAYGKANTYKLEFDFASRGNANLRDFWVNHDFGAVHLRAGQWKRPFTRAQISADFGLQFLESSLSTQFATDRLVRDIGLAVHNDYEKTKDGVEWVVGFFNGTGEGARQRLTCEDPSDPEGCAISTPSNVPADFDPLVTARIGFNHGGIKGYSEGDVEGGPLRFAAGTGYKLDFNNFDKDAAGDLVLGHAGTLDGVLKVEGFSVAGAVTFVKVGQADADLTFFGQSGYLVVPKKLELAARFAQLPEAPGADDSLQEILGAVTWFFESHSFKWMLDGGVIRHTAGEGAIDQQIRTQVQLVF
jgi:phosphate-selective porin OprO/OprP